MLDNNDIIIYRKATKGHNINQDKILKRLSEHRYKINSESIILDLLK